MDIQLSSIICFQFAINCDHASQANADLSRVFLNLLKHDIPSYCEFFPMVLSLRNLPMLAQGGVMATHDEETRKFFKHSSVICVLSPRYASNKLSIFKQQASFEQEFVVFFFLVHLCIRIFYCFAQQKEQTEPKSHPFLLQLTLFFWSPSFNFVRTDPQTVTNLHYLLANHNGISAFF